MKRRRCCRWTASSPCSAASSCWEPSAIATHPTRWSRLTRAPVASVQHSSPSSSTLFSPTYKTELPPWTPIGARWAPSTGRLSPTLSRQLPRTGSSGDPLHLSTLRRKIFPAPSEPPSHSSGQASPRPWETIFSGSAGSPPRCALSATRLSTQCNTSSPAQPTPLTSAQLISGSDLGRWQVSSLPCPPSPTSRTYLRPLRSPYRGPHRLRSPPPRPGKDLWHRQQQQQDVTT